MNITIAENAHSCLALVRPTPDAPLSIWARQDHDDWSYLGTMGAEDRTLSAAVTWRDIKPLADQLARLDAAFYAHVDTLVES